MSALDIIRTNGKLNFEERIHSQAREEDYKMRVY
jgi:hypothetical protein